MPAAAPTPVPQGLVDLDDLVGQPRAVRELGGMLAAGRLPHALLFVGPPGVGKMTAARALAARLLADGKDKLAAGLHPDLITLVPGGAGKVISVEPIRELGALLGYPPHEGAVRVVLMDEADRLTIEAGNAFLKTLEEPPPRNHFILTTSAPERLLVTIRSRCQQIRFLPLAAADIRAILVARGAPAAQAERAAALAGGSASRGAELADSDALERRARGLALLRDAARQGDFASISGAASELAQAKDELGAILDLAAVWYRDAAALAAGAPAEILVHGPGDAAALADEAKGRTPAGLARCAGAVLEAQTALLGYASAPLALEKLMLQIRKESRA